MRAAFNTTFDVYGGPTGSLPGVLRFSGPCRVVQEALELPQDMVLSQRVAYITSYAGVPYGPAITGSVDNYVYDYGQSDRIAVPTGTTPIYEVLFVELVIPKHDIPYYRSHVRYVPGLSVLLQEDLWALLQEDGSLLLLP